MVVDAWEKKLFWVRVWWGGFIPPPQVHKQYPATYFVKGEDPGSGQIIFCVLVVCLKFFYILILFIFCGVYDEYLSDYNENILWSIGLN